MSAAPAQTSPAYAMGSVAIAGERMETPIPRSSGSAAAAAATGNTLSPATAKPIHRRRSQWASHQTAPR